MVSLAQWKLSQDSTLIRKLQECQDNSMGTEQSFQQMVLGQLDISM